MLEKIRLFLKTNHIDGIFVSKHANITYLTGFDFFVETEREAFLFITQSKAHVITSQLYKEDVEKYAPHFTVLDFVTKGKSFWEFIDDELQKEAKEISKVLQNEHIYTLGFESTNITVAEYTRLKKLQTKLTPIILDTIREIKTPDEIEKLQKACALTDETYADILKHIKPGMTEKQIAFQLDLFIREHGAEPSFRSIVAFGKGSSVPHHTITDTKLEKSDTVLLDFGVKLHNYCSDMSRTFFIGNPTNYQKKVYLTVLESQKKQWIIFPTIHFLFQDKKLIEKQGHISSKNIFQSFPML